MKTPKPNALRRAGQRCRSQAVLALLCFLSWSPVAQGSALDACAALDFTGAPFSEGPPVFADSATIPRLIRQVPEEQRLRFNRGGYSFYVPQSEFPDQPLLGCGYLDVTAPPFNADGSGSAASASANVQAFRAALLAGREYMLAVLVPAGDYLIDDVIECTMGYNDDIDQQADRQGACLLVGSRAGTARPTLQLTSDAPGYDDPLLPKPMLWFWARASDGDGGPTVPRPQRVYHSGVVGIDFDTAQQPGAIGLRLAAAQGSMLEDVAVQATGSHTGVLGVPSAGGNVSNLSIHGGRFGLDLLTDAGETNISQVPVLVGLTLIGQTETAFRYGSLEAGTMVGAHIQVPPGNLGPAVVAESTVATNAHLNLIDTAIEFEQADPANVAIASNRGLYLRNLFLRQASTAVAAANGQMLPGLPDDWRQISEFALAAPNGVRFGQSYRFPIYVNGADQGATYQALGTDGEAPPPDLMQRHLYDEGTFPSAEWATAVNIKAPPFNAVGDYLTDDTAAIQQAIDEGHEVIYFPKGAYGVTETLRLRPETRLVGTARHLSLLVARDDPGGDFEHQHDARPVIESADTSLGDTVLAHLGIYNPTHVPGSTNLHWRTGSGSVLRTLNHIRERAVLEPTVNSNEAMLLFTGNAGGRVYGHYRMDIQEAVNDSYRHVLVEGTRAPLSFYQFNLEGFSNNRYTMAEFNDAQFVSAYGFKGEGRQRMYFVRDSSYINIYGTGGFSKCTAYTACIDVQRSSPLRIAGAVKRGFRETPPVRAMIRDVLSGGGTFATRIRNPAVRPVLYARGALW